MAIDITALMAIAKRGDAISAQTRIALLEFDAAIMADDRPKQEEIRVKMHQLVDDQLDLQLEVNKIKRDHEEQILARMRRGDFK